MSHLGVSRFLSKREKHHAEKQQGRDKSLPRDASHVKEAKPPDNFHGLFAGPEKAVDSHEEQKVKLLRRRIMEAKFVIMKDPQILWALHSSFSKGDTDKAFDLLMAISNSSEGLLMDYSPSVKLLGSENRQGVTCFLDSVLFAIFSRLDSFEAMLYNSFEDAPRNRLALLLRLWVNLLRSGKLITTDLTKLIQDSLAECGWRDAAKLQQQDASEAFTFITGKLELPLLTLKMDLYHTGREDAADDHKFINERLLEVAIPSDLSNDNQTVTLEDCLENYFNNRVEVRRYLERRLTLNSMRSYETSAKGGAIHVETVEVDPDSFPNTPLSSSPSAASLSRPQKYRSPSIIQQRFIPEKGEPEDTEILDIDSKRPISRGRKGSIRKEVLMPAWQFFSLIPWYTDNTITSDTQVAAHFSSKRPILGICLKRYSMTAKGKAIRLNTNIDIPVEIGLPHFIQDDHMEDHGPIFGNFKLSLQSVVCHRGNSVSSGHYISLVRSTNMNVGFTMGSSETEDAKHWMRFDDLAQRRITLVDIEQALREETPYLLFYQIVPIDGDPGHITEGEKQGVYGTPGGHDSGVAGLSMPSLSLSSTAEDKAPSGRRSFEIAAPESPRGRSPVAEASNVAFTRQVKISGQQAPENHAPGQVSRPSSHSRKNSSQGLGQNQAGEILSRSLSRLSLSRRKSKERVPTERVGDSEVIIKELSSSTTDPVENLNVPRKDGRREKSRNRLSKGPEALGKRRVQKPERECSVM